MVGWYTGNSEKKTHPVATLTPNELGLYDMTGNVWEWTSDFDSKNYNKSKDKDKRVARGGGIESTADFCFNHFRWGFYPSWKYTEEEIKEAEEEYKKMGLGAYIPTLLGLRLAL